FFDAREEDHFAREIFGRGEGGESEQKARNLPGAHDWRQIYDNAKKRKFGGLIRPWNSLRMVNDQNIDPFLCLTQLEADFPESFRNTGNRQPGRRIVIELDRQVAIELSSQVRSIVDAE